MRALLALLLLLGGCTLLLSSSDHQGGSAASPLDGAADADGGSDAGDGGGAPEDAGACDMDRDGHRATGSCGGDDCDDGRADVHPGALPVCGDGVVNDCAFRGEEALAAQLTGMETADGELGIVPPRKLGQVTSPDGKRTLGLAMAPGGGQGGGIWIAHLAGPSDLARTPVLVHGSGDQPLELDHVAFPEPEVAFRDVTTVALGSGESASTVTFALFARQPFDGDGDGTPDTRGWLGTLGPRRGTGSIDELAPGSEPTTAFPRAAIAGGSPQYPEHFVSLFEAQGGAHFMRAFPAADASSQREVRTDAGAIVARGGLVEAVATRGQHLLLHEPGSSRAHVWAYAANPGTLPSFSLSTLLESDVTGPPGFAYLGRQTGLDQYALLAAGRGKVEAAVISCPVADPGACTLALGGTTVSIPLAHAEDEARGVAATTMRESALVAALTRVLPNDSSDEELALTLLGLSGIMRTFTVFPGGFAGAGTRVLDAQLAAMRSQLTRGGSATTIGYAALVENDLAQDELHYGLMRACDAR